MKLGSLPIARIYRAATANSSQTRPNILPQIFLTGCFFCERIETQNLGKAQALEALPAVAPLLFLNGGFF